jgi:hypothetical protein
MAGDLELIKAIRRRRAEGITDLGAEVRRRVQDFGPVRIDTDVRREAFAELAAPFEVAPYRLIVRGDSFLDPARESVTLRMVLVEPVSGAEPNVVASIERTFLLGDGLVDHGFLTVGEAFRGRAITPQIMLASFARYDQLSIETISVHAGLGAGRYYWSGKVGFDFAREADQRHVERWATFVLGALRLPMDLDGISRPQQWALLGTTADPAPVARFSELASTMTKVPTTLLDPNGTGIVGLIEAQDVECEPGMVDFARHLRTVADDNRIGWNTEIPLGKLIMLSGPDWWGTFDLTDPVSRTAYQSSAEQAIAKAVR